MSKFVVTFQEKDHTLWLLTGEQRGNSVHFKFSSTNESTESALTRRKSQVPCQSLSEAGLHPCLSVCCILHWCLYSGKEPQCCTLHCPCAVAKLVFTSEKTEFCKRKPVETGQASLALEVYFLVFNNVQFVLSFLEQGFALAPKQQEA